MLHGVFIVFFAVLVNTSFMYYQSQESTAVVLVFVSVFFIRYIMQEEIQALKSSCSEGD
jgi:hypothetical protein